MSTRLDTAPYLPELLPAALEDLEPAARDYLQRLDEQLRAIFRDTAHRLWALETSVEIAPRHPRNLFMATAPDGASTQPEADLISGWDGLNVRAAKVQQRDGDNVLFTYDPTARELLEQVLFEMRRQNELLMSITKGLENAS